METEIIDLDIYIYILILICIYVNLTFCSYAAESENPGAIQLSFLKPPDTTLAVICAGFKAPLSGVTAVYKDPTAKKN